MNPEDYRKQLLDEIADVRRRPSSYRGFFDTTSSDVQRLADLALTLEAASPSENAALQEVALDRDETDDVRAASLHRLACTGEQEDTGIETLLRVLGSKEETKTIRLAAISALKQSLFVSPRMRERRGDYLAALRAAAESEDLDVRTSAIELLAKRRDPQTQFRLLKGLRGEDALPVLLEKAIQFIGYDIHTDVYPVLRRYATEDVAENVALESVRVLSADPGSAGLLAGIFRDRHRTEIVRTACAAALQQVDPTRFQKEAKELAVDETESVALRASSLAGLERFASPAALRADVKFNDALNRMAEGSTDQVKDVARRLSSRLNH